MKLRAIAKHQIKKILKSNDLGQKYVDRRTALYHADRDSGSDILNMGGGNTKKDADFDSEFRVKPNLVSENSLFGKYYEAHFSMLNYKDSQKLDALIDVIDSMNLDIKMLPNVRDNSSPFERSKKEVEVKNNKIKSDLCDSVPTFNLFDLLNKVSERYPILEYFDDYHFGYKWNEEFAKATLNYINIVDCTYNDFAEEGVEETKKKVNDAKKNSQKIINETKEKLTDKVTEL